MEEHKILDSWKEISVYLSRSVMTCQRWEKQLDLPVHRLDGTPKARVFAYPEELDSWLAEKLHSREAQAELEEARSRRTRRLVVAGAGAVLVFAAIGGAAWRFYFHPVVQAPAKVPVLAVLPFENKTGDPAWDAWKMALADLLTIDLRQSKFLEVVRTSAIYQAAGPAAEAEGFSSQDLQAIAAKTGASHIVTGSFIKAGRNVVLTALVHDAAKGDLPGSPRASLRSERDVFSGVDRLTKEIKASLRIGARERRGDIDKPVARVTTRSPEAFRSLSTAYRSQGRGRGGAGKFDDAVAPMLKAVEIDPDFGLAFRYLHYACRALSRTDEAKKFGREAVRLAGRIDERERALFLEDYFFNEERDNAKAVLALRRLEKNYPYDRLMTELTDYYREREEWDAALPILERLILRFPRQLTVLRRLLDGYRSLGRYQEAERILDDRLGPNPEAGDEMSPLLAVRRDVALAQGHFDVAHACVERLKAADPTLLSYYSNKGFLYFMQDDLANAEKMYQKLAESDRPRIRQSGFEYLAAVSLSRGRIEEARERILKAIDVVKGRSEYEAPSEKSYRTFLAYLERLSGRLPEACQEAERAYAAGENDGLVLVLPVLYLKALTTVETNRFDEFEKQAEEIRKYVDPDRFPFGSPRYIRVYDNLLGHRELQKKNFTGAIQYFWKALDRHSPLAARTLDGDHAKYYYDLAEAYRMSGDIPAAVPIYEKVLLTTVSREFSGDLYARSYYWLGRDAEMRMNAAVAPDMVRERRQKAVEYYRKFLSLWGEADSIFTEVGDARGRLAVLEAR